MDWERAIERNSEAIYQIVSSLFALFSSAQLAGIGVKLPRRVWRHILLVLRPAEAAVRRLIIIAARALSCAAPMLRKRCSNAVRTAVERPANTIVIAPVFQLFDPLKRFEFDLDDEEDPGEDMALSSPDLDDAPVDAGPLLNRMRALRLALVDLPKQAARLARFNARRDLLLKARRPVRLSPMRPGLPPGWRERRKHEIDTVLRECHRLVQYLEDTKFAATSLDSS